MYKTKKSMFLLFSLLYYFREIDTCDECGKLYEPPSNIKFPYGDENQLNTDISESDTNTIICSDKQSLAPEQGRCPFPPEDPGDLPLAFPYVLCPMLSNPTSPSVPIVRLGPNDETLPPPIVQCKTCNLKLTEDDAAVYLKCVDCHDLPSPERTANCTEIPELLYKVYFIEIANYTTVKVTGKENF